MSEKPETTMADGSPVYEGHREIQASGMQAGYVVLSEDERAKGFVRPFRKSYVHVGCPPPANLRDLTSEEHERYDQFGYLKFEAYPEEKLPVTGKFWTKDTLARLGGCKGVTTMGDAIAATYARDPKFYGATFCCHCGGHFPVGELGEFVWDGTDERVGT